jgi:hypothetical protein
LNLALLQFKHFWIDILGLWWPGEKTIRPQSHWTIRFQFTRRVLFDFQRLCAEYQTEYRNKDGKATAVVIDVDAAKELCAHYRASKEGRTEYSYLVYPPAKLFSRRLFELAIGSRNVKGVIFLAGGTASGKSSVVASYKHQDRSLVIMDGTLSDYAIAHQQIWRCIAAGKFALVVYVYTPIDVAMTRALDRAINRGRVLSLEVFSATHFESQKTIQRLQKCHNYEINFAIRAFNGLNGDALEFETIPIYKSLHDVQSRANDCFERELLDRSSQGKPIPGRIIEKFRQSGRRVG